ncbi:unnamed protein product [Tuber melanosporum]|uniref:(Perigord truffle) hypothetical protein n=1 Tax=Tuber melanosporum (strain Mel28) TaxID=656061 RepID=D5GEB8_TUBMM|nr:uncharacterized protein GSTUM_00001257001 [Tuber melanosporum]CAZ82861.1 unnamed protein product [Tuber melanosporum]
MPTKGPPRAPKPLSKTTITSSSSSKLSKTPSNWPPEIIYLTRPRLSRSLPAEALTHLSLSPTSPPSIPSTLVRIRKITDLAHPAFGQLGLFAAKTLPARSFILDYLGYVHDDNDLDESSDYDLCLDKELHVGVDARSMGNEGRMVNDYRGVPGLVRANVVFETRRIGGDNEGEVRMGLWVGSRDVKKGVELCVSYGKGFWKERVGEVEDLSLNYSKR